MEWISVKDELPEFDCMCIVCNERGYMTDQRALYDPTGKVFKLYNPRGYETLVLDVTHYYIMPQMPEKPKEKQ